jgi:uncharacterized protein YciI
MFAVSLRYTDDITTRDSLRTAHRDYLGVLADQGALLLSGPCGPDEAPGALAVPGRRQGPHRRTGRGGSLASSWVIAESQTAEWNPVIGLLLTAI